MESYVFDSSKYSIPVGWRTPAHPCCAYPRIWKFVGMSLFCRWDHDVVVFVGGLLCHHLLDSAQTFPVSAIGPPGFNHANVNCRKLPARAWATDDGKGCLSTPAPGGSVLKNSHSAAFRILRLFGFLVIRT